MEVEEITPATTLELWLGALHGAPALAVELELERLGISDEADS